MKLIATITTDIDSAIDRIVSKYGDLVENGKITILSNQSEDNYVLTYNLNVEYVNLLPNSFIIHKHGQTNTIFTINALNKLVDKYNSKNVDWENYRNTMISTDNGCLKINETEFLDTYLF